MGCCSDFIKYLLFLFNILFWIAGGALLGVGIYLRVANNVDAVVQVAGLEFYYAGCYVLISVGAVMFLVGFFGCCGAIKENKCLLGLYFSCLLIIFVIQLTIGIWAAVSQSSIEAEIQKGLNKNIPINSDPKNPMSSTVIAIQKSFKCCGLVSNCTDWTGGLTTGCGCTETAANNNTCAPIPSECSATDGAVSIYNTDCYDAILKFINDNIGIIAGIGIGIGVAEIFGMVFAIIMCRNPSKGYETY